MVTADAESGAESAAATTDTSGWATLPLAPGRWVVWGDAPDLLLRDVTSGDVWIWLTNGATALNQTDVGRVADPGDDVAGVADTDPDEKAGILWRHRRPPGRPAGIRDSR